MRHWNVLIVDDDVNDRFLLQRSLLQFNGSLHVCEAEDGEEAIRYLNGAGKFSDRKQFPFPTFIFTDLKMPKLDGFAVMDHLKKNPQWAVIPTLVFSASNDADDVKKAFLCGACAYHVKPASIEERDALCRKLLEYWSSSEIPQTDAHGMQLKTQSQGKLGERIEQP